MAVSIDKFGFEESFEPAHFERTVSIATQLLEHTMRENIFDDVDYLQLNAPRPDLKQGSVELTEQTHAYEMDATFENQGFD